jgi:hypothetical protein
MTPETRADVVMSMALQKSYIHASEISILRARLINEFRAVAFEEREACAKIAEDHFLWVHQDACYEEIAAKIRARG